MTMDTMLPVIRQMHDAGNDRQRAQILLSVPDAVLNKYSHVFEEACRRAGFEPGIAFVTLRVAACHAVRDASGLLPADMTQTLETYRAALARFAAEPAPTEI